MDKLSAKNLIEETINYPFSGRRFLKLVSNIFKSFDQENELVYIKNKYREHSNHIDSCAYIGKYEEKRCVIDIYAVKLSDGIDLDSARTSQRNFIVRLLEERRSQAAIVAFVPISSDKTVPVEDWRFSLITVDYKEVWKNGKIIVRQEYSPPKRYSFLVGKNEPNHTAQKQIIPLLRSTTKPSIETLQNAFSVEKVSHEFFIKFKEKFLVIKNEIDNLIKEDERNKIEFETGNVKSGHFSQKLLGQLVFLYFIQKKGWLGVGKDEHGNFMSWGLGDNRFLQNLFEKKYIGYQNFYTDILQPLIYLTLSVERKNDYSNIFDCKIPFLGSGLFEPINNYNWRETNLTISNTIFQNIFSTFDRFNFTVNENDPLDKEIAIDPEVLGKVFENMLPDNLRKGSGTFYTPSSIVEYISQECLINYLKNRLSNLKDTDIRTFIKYSYSQNFSGTKTTKESDQTTANAKYLPERIIQTARDIDRLLAEIKICDPAVGSGAFPIGIIHEIVNAREMLTPFTQEIYRTRYDLKRNCIQNSIYGVDIDGAAIDIARLRLWLSLIIEQNKIDVIKPLPNLHFKLMQGNSLIQTFHGLSVTTKRGGVVI